MSILSELFNTHYSYDSENHLISATINGNHEAVYTYNALGLRDSKTTQRGTVYYVYDGMNLIAELDEDSEILAYYSHDLDGKLVSATYGDETYFYHFNHRGDTLYLTDHEGNIAARYTYDTWGNIIGKSGDLANKNPYRWEGRHGYYYDADTDLYLLNSRWYNPELKRLMTRDNHRGEAADPVSLNRYVYCGNDPEAAVVFVKKAVPFTLDDGKERGAFIYEIRIAGLGERYFYPYTFKGMHNNVILGLIAGYGGLPRVSYPWFSIHPMSFAHTHPKCGCHIGDKFSPVDEYLTYLPGIKYVYLGTPEGKTLRIDRNNLTPVEIKIYRLHFFYWV